MIDVAREQDINEIVLLGDFADFYNVSSHGKDAGIRETLRFEINDVQKRLKDLSLFFPKANKIYIVGNHEWRLHRYINSNCPDLYGIVDLELILNCADNKFKLIPYGPNQFHKVLNSKLLARHEPIAGGIHCAHGTVAKALHSVIFGHTHRIQESQIVSIDGKNLRGISCGWLGDPKHEVFSYLKNHHQWASGFSIVRTIPDGTWFNELIHIINGKCFSNGKFYH